MRSELTTQRYPVLITVRICCHLYGNVSLGKLIWEFSAAQVWCRRWAASTGRLRRRTHIPVDCVIVRGHQRTAHPSQEWVCGRLLTPSLSPPARCSILPLTQPESAACPAPLFFFLFFLYRLQVELFEKKKRKLRINGATNPFSFKG